MNQLWAWLVTGLVTGVIAPAVVLAIHRWTSLRLPLAPLAATGIGYVVVHGAVTISLVVGFRPPVWGALHVVLLAAGVVYWSPILDPRRPRDGPGRFAYVLVTAPFLDLAAVAIAGLGHPDGAVAMIVGMLPLNIVAVLLAWRWLMDEDRKMDEALASAVELSSPGWLPPGVTPTGVARPSIGEES